MLSLFCIGFLARANFQIILGKMGHQASVRPIEGVEVLVGRLMGVKELYIRHKLVNHNINHSYLKQRDVALIAHSCA